MTSLKVLTWNIKTQHTHFQTWKEDKKQSYQQTGGDQNVGCMAQMCGNKRD